MSYVFSFTFFSLPLIFTLHWRPLAFLILSLPLQNFHFVLPTEKCLLCFFAFVFLKVQDSNLNQFKALQGSNLNHICFHNSWLTKIPFTTRFLETDYTLGKSPKNSCCFKLQWANWFEVSKFPPHAFENGNSIVQTSVRQAKGDVQIHQSNFAKHSKP